jgi:CRISPR-associated protein Csd2
MMFELDRSASKGLMSCRGLYVFTHENKLGKAPSHKLFDLVNVNRKTDESILENEEPTPARSFSDYEVIIDKNKMPDGVTLKEII